MVDYGIAGGLSAVHYMDYVEETVNVELEESILLKVIEVDPCYFEATAFPNPAASDATLALEIHQTGKFEILLYDMSGRMVQSIYSGELVEGRQNFQVELSQENSGMYLVKVLSEG